MCLAFGNLPTPSNGPIEVKASRSGCASKLVELTLARCADPASEIIALLQQTPGLTTLMLDVHSPSAEIVAALMAPERLCPTLESLTWADFSNALDGGAFADMVVSRCPDSMGVHPLRSVVLLAGRRRLKTAECVFTRKTRSPLISEKMSRFCAVRRISRSLKAPLGPHGARISGDDILGRRGFHGVESLWTNQKVTKESRCIVILGMNQPKFEDCKCIMADVHLSCGGAHSDLTDGKKTSVARPPASHIRGNRQ
ncbi:hypothetical protein B0H13DRAFT_2440541 [Mycena leptocephala]|nr:hypothetical protein B0H13DRAFT_2440541 [Mycena leptocephala]